MTQGAIGSNKLDQLWTRMVAVSQHLLVKPNSIVRRLLSSHTIDLSHVMIRYHFVTPWLVLEALVFIRNWRSTNLIEYNICNMTTRCTPCRASSYTALIYGPYMYLYLGHVSPIYWRGSKEVGEASKAMRLAINVSSIGFLSVQQTCSGPAGMK